MPKGGFSGRIVAFFRFVRLFVRSLCVLFLFSAAVVSTTEPVRCEENEECRGCHAQEGTGAPRVDFKAFRFSIHGKNQCIACHSDAASIPHAEKLAPVACRNCHRTESRVYLDSDHGRHSAEGKPEAAACKDCHGPAHSVLGAGHPDSPVNRRNLPKTCVRCHGDRERMDKFRLSISAPMDSYSHTVHGEAYKLGIASAAVCTDCHGTHDLNGAADSASRIFWRNVPQTCGRCHAKVLEVYRRSIHGLVSNAGIKESPVCTSCHGEHTIRSPKDPSSSAYVGALTKTCSGCHALERLTAKFGLPLDRFKSYMDTYHGLAYQKGDFRVANCASCHGFHDVLPSADPLSSVNRTNMSKTCGKCHPGAGVQLSAGSVHGPVRKKHWSLEWAYLFYLLVIPMTIGGMLLHNGMDFLRKVAEGVSHGHEEEGMRLTLNERLQHGILAPSFLLLAYSGFALKYPEAWWALPLSFTGEGARRLVHRWTAVVFCALGVYHALYLLAAERGRSVLRGLLPRLQDALDAFQLTAYNAGLRAKRPVLSKPYNYIEKSEYWALVWGSFVMVGTGALLVFPSFTLRRFPLWAAELATLVHYYEAVLACLAILVWHWYWVIFDPDVYPMNRAWLTGFIRPGAREDDEPRSDPHDKNIPL